MLCTSLQNLKEIIENKLNKENLPPRVLQSHFRIGIDPSKGLLGDPTYMPFYYHIGKQLEGSKNLLEFGFDLGIPSGCFISGCGSIDNFVAFRKKDEKYYPKRLGIHNIHNILRKKFDLWIGEETDPEFIKMVLLRKWDCAIISENGKKEKTYTSYLYLIWEQMINDGLIIVDYLKEPAIKSAYELFCRSQNREPFTINTFRGTGILQK